MACISFIGKDPKNGKDPHRDPHDNVRANYCDQRLFQTIVNHYQKRLVSLICLLGKYVFTLFEEKVFNRSPMHYLLMQFGFERGPIFQRRTLNNNVCVRGFLYLPPLDPKNGLILGMIFRASILKLIQFFFIFLITNPERTH